MDTSTRRYERAVAVMVAALCACGPGDPSVRGTVRLGGGVDPTPFSQLVLASAPHAAELSDLPPAELVVHERLDLATLEWPADFHVASPQLPQRGWLIAWLTADPDAEWYEEEEPHGDAPFELCACATHVPAYAENVDVELE